MFRKSAFIPHGARGGSWAGLSAFSSPIAVSSQARWTGRPPRDMPARFASSTRATMPCSISISPSYGGAQEQRAAGCSQQQRPHYRDLRDIDRGAAEPFGSEVRSKKPILRTIKYSKWYSKYDLEEASKEEIFTSTSYYESMNRFRRFTRIPVVDCFLDRPESPSLAGNDGAGGAMGRSVREARRDGGDGAGIRRGRRSRILQSLSRKKGNFLRLPGISGVHYRNPRRVSRLLLGQRRQAPLDHSPPVRPCRATNYMLSLFHSRTNSNTNLSTSSC